MKFLALSGVLMLAVVPVGNDSHTQNHDWYRQLKTRQGGSCCSGNPTNGDCHTVRARQRFDGQWEAQLLGGWWQVPPEAILRDELNQQPLHAHICERQGRIYCFLRPGNGS